MDRQTDRCRQQERSLPTLNTDHCSVSIKLKAVVVTLCDLHIYFCIYNKMREKNVLHEAREIKGSVTFNGKLGCGGDAVEFDCVAGNIINLAVEDRQRVLSVLRRDVVLLGPLDRLVGLEPLGLQIRLGHLAVEHRLESEVVQLHVLQTSDERARFNCNVNTNNLINNLIKRTDTVTLRKDSRAVCW